jgi:hypothetical protein
LNDQFNPYIQKLQQRKFDPAKHLDNSFVDSLTRPTNSIYDSQGGLKIAEISDGQALSGSLYYSTTQKALTYKNAEGKLFQLAMQEIPLS